VAVRPASKEDEEWIRALIPRLHEFGPPRFRDVAAMDDAEAAATASAIEGSDDRTVLVAADEAGARLGFVHIETAVDFFTRQRHGHISTLVVASEAEGHGVGRALLDAAEHWCRARAYPLLTLNVFEANGAARRLYERAGFRIDPIKYLKKID